jgi:hypothetical protein
VRLPLSVERKKKMELKLTKQQRKDQAKTVKNMRRASKLLKEVGWCQGSYTKYDDNHPHGPIPVAYCMIGALTESGGGFDLPARLAISKYLREKKNWHSSIPAFNDKKGRTKREVLDVLRFAANRLEKEIKK